MANSLVSDRSTRTKASRRPPGRPKTVGRTEPRIFTPPLRPLEPRSKTTEARTKGYAVIDFAADVLGIELLPWQKWLLVHALELLPDGTFRYRTVVVLVARQNGKSTLSMVLALFFMYVLGRQLVIGTAQDLDLAEEIWQGAVDLAEEVDELAEMIEKVVKVNGKKSLNLTTGERYKVKAANRRAGRGLSGDLTLLDELREHQTWQARGAITKTTMARQLAMNWALSNAGDVTSVVLAYLRALAHIALGNPDGLDESKIPVPEIDEDEEADPDSLGIFEWSAPPGCETSDREGWAYANPAMGYTITERAIADARRTDPEAVFRTEVLCQWVESRSEPIFGFGKWGPLLDAQADVTARFMFGIDTTPDRAWTSIGVASDFQGKTFVDVGAHDMGTRWVVKECSDLQARYPEAAFAIDGQSPAASLIPELEAAGVRLVVLNTQECKKACGWFYDRVTSGEVAHLNNPDLNSAVAGAEKRTVGDGWLYDRKRSAVICPLVAVTWAAWAFSNHLTGPSVYEERGVILL